MAHVVYFTNPTWTAIPGHFFLEQALYAELKACSESLPFILNIGELFHCKNILGWMFCILWCDGQLGADTRGGKQGSGKNKQNKTQNKTNTHRLWRQKSLHATWESTGVVTSQKIGVRGTYRLEPLFKFWWALGIGCGPHLLVTWFWKD